MLKSRLYKFIGYAFTLLSFVYLFFLLNEYSPRFQIEFELQNFILAILVGFVIFFGVLVLVFSWFLQLISVGVSITFSQSFNIIGKSQIVKYLPGNFAHMVGRYFLSKELMRKKIFINSLLLESVLLILAASIVGIYLIFQRFYFIPVIWYFSAVSVFIVFFICLYSLVRKYIGLPNVPIKVVLLILTLFIISLFVHGVGLYLSSLVLGDNHGISYVDLTVFFSFAFVAGYILPGASGGIGVRESIFVSLFEPGLTQAFALEIIIFYRCVSVVVDIVFFAFVSIVKR